MRADVQVQEIPIYQQPIVGAVALSSRCRPVLRHLSIMDFKIAVGLVCEIHVDVIEAESLC